MKILAIDLPSHGFNSSLNYVNLSPMTYRNMIEYSNNSSKDKLTQLMTDIELLRKDNPGIEELNYFDFESVLLMKKLISVTSTPTVSLSLKCSECNSLSTIKVGVDEIHYTPFDSDIVSNISSIKLGDKVINVKMPKLSDVRKVVSMMQLTRSDIAFDIIKTLTILDFGDRPNDVVNAVNSATLDEILLLEYLRNSFIGGTQKVEFTCSQCMRKESVAIDIVASDMFRVLELNEVINKNKITLLKGVQS